MSDKHVDHVRADDAEADHERVVDHAFAERHGDDAPAEELGGQPGHRNRDISQLGLLNDNMDEVFEQRSNYQPNPDVAKALDDLAAIPVQEAIEEADG